MKKLPIGIQTFSKIIEGNALTQIKEKNYHQKYKNKDGAIHIVKIGFNKKEKNIVNF